MKTSRSSKYLHICDLRTRGDGPAPGERRPGVGLQHVDRQRCAKSGQRKLISLVGVIGLFHYDTSAPVPHVEPANPKNNILRDIRGVIRDPFEIARR